MLLAAAVVGLFVVGDDDAGHDGTAEEVALPFELEEATVYAYDTGFHSLPSLQVAVGDKVTFDNRDDKPHTFTSDEGLFDSETIDAGKRYGYAYAAPGTYHYHCEIHPLMKGTVVVVPADQ